MSDRDEKIRQEILQGAQQQFQRYGYKKTTIEDIAGSIGKGKSTLYYYFKNKEDLFREVLWSEWHAIYDRIQSGIRQGDSLEEKIKSMIRLRIEGVAHFANVYRALRSEALLKYQFIRDFRKEARAKEISMIKRFLLEMGNALRHRSETQLELIAFALASILLGIQEAILWELKDEEFQRPEFIETVADMVLNGITKTEKI